MIPTQKRFLTMLIFTVFVWGLHFIIMATRKKCNQVTGLSETRYCCHLLYLHSSFFHKGFLWSSRPGQKLIAYISWIVKSGDHSWRYVVLNGQWWYSQYCSHICRNFYSKAFKSLPSIWVQRGIYEWYGMLVEKILSIWLSIALELNGPITVTYVRKFKSRSHAHRGGGEYYGPILVIQPRSSSRGLMVDGRIQFLCSHFLPFIDSSIPWPVLFVHLGIEHCSIFCAWSEASPRCHQLFFLPYYQSK